MASYSLRSTEFMYSLIAAVLFFGTAMVALGAADARLLAFEIAPGTPTRPTWPPPTLSLSLSLSYESTGTHSKHRHITHTGAHRGST
jgi:hypothetical protein